MIAEQRSSRPLRKLIPIIERDIGGVLSFLQLTKAKSLFTIGLLIASFGLAAIAYQFFNSIFLTSALFFPIRIYHRIRPILREPGYQDVMYGDCLIPYCDQASVVITVVVSAVLYFSLAAVILRVVSE